MATRRAKKRKCHEAELDAGVTPPASEKPEAGEGPDQISNLHPDVLRRIVSLLPTKDGARTQSLSTPWRHLFRSAPLNLGVELRRKDEPAPSSLVSRILADHQARCRRLSLTWYGYKSDFVSPLLNRWLQSPALNDLPEFDLWQNRKENEPKSEKCHEAELDTGVTPPASEKPEAGEGLDQISNLHPDVLRRIVSLLPTKDGARTQSLSTPWRHLFRSAPLNLGVELRREDEPSPSSLVSRILADHQAPCRRLSLTWYDYKSDFVSQLLNRWLQSPALNGLSEFDLWQKRKRRDEERRELPREEDLYALPPSVLRFSPTLRILSIKCTGCMIHFPSVGDLHFLIFKQLTLKGVVSSEGVLHDVLAGCFVLESLVLSELDGVRGVRINSSTLRRLGNRKKYISEWIAAQPRKLQLDNRASEGAQFNFTPDSHYSDGIHIGHIHDLTASDPFDRSLCRCDSVDFL
ncbi:hypothetical protein ACQ4PT_053580 [Festuca glaucescens]